MEYFSTIKKNEIISFSGKRTETDIIMSNKISPAERQILHGI
jgi:hypothetical protein